MISLYLIRHGDSTAIGKFLSGRAAGVTLTPKGITEVQALANLLSDFRLDAIYSSPMERTVDTARAIRHLCSNEIQVEPAINEVDFGEWTGLTFDQLHHNPDWKQWFTTRSSAYAPGGETMKGVQDRMVKFLQSLENKHPDGHVAVVSHGDVIRAALCHFFQTSLDAIDHFDIDTASVTLVEVGRDFWRVRYLNLTGMLFDKQSQ